MVQERLSAFFSDQIDWFYCWVLNDFWLIVEQSDKFQQRSVNELLFALIFNTNQEWGKGSDTGLSVFPALMFDCIWSKVEHDSFVFFGIILEDGFKTFGSSINDSIFLVFLTVLINDTEIFKKPSDNLSTSFARNIVFD